MIASLLPLFEVPNSCCSSSSLSSSSLPFSLSSRSDCHLAPFLLFLPPSFPLSAIAFFPDLFDPPTSTCCTARQTSCACMQHCRMAKKPAVIRVKTPDMRERSRISVHSASTHQSLSLAACGTGEATSNNG